MIITFCNELLLQQTSPQCGKCWTYAEKHCTKK